MVKFANIKMSEIPTEMFQKWNVVLESELFAQMLVAYGKHTMSANDLHVHTSVGENYCSLRNEFWTRVS